MTDRATIARESLRRRAQAAFPRLSLQEALSAYQKHIRSKVSSQACALNGAKGYKAMVDAGKGDIASQKAAEWRFDHPSDLERIIISHLMLLECPVGKTNREVKIGRYYTDFKYGQIVIEVNDDTWHTNDFHGDDRVSHDQGKYAYLRAQGYTTIILSEQVTRSGQAFKVLADVLSSLVEEDF